MMKMNNSVCLPFPPIFNNRPLEACTVARPSRPWTAAPRHRSPLLYASRQYLNALTPPGFVCEAAQQGRVHDIVRTGCTAQARVPTEDGAKNERTHLVALFYCQVKACSRPGSSDDNKKDRKTALHTITFIVVISEAFTMSYFINSLHY